MIGQGDRKDDRIQEEETKNLDSIMFPYILHTLLINPQASLTEVHFGSQVLGEAKTGTREGECQKPERKQRVRFCEAQAG
jgi:hypothetical protein